jgi:type IV secretion system protein VirB11
VVEVTLNSDGRLWINRPSSGLIDAGESLSPPTGN